MRIRVRHDTHYHYDHPAKSVIQLVRLTPRNHEGQHIVYWRIDISSDCRLRASEDAFGNIVHDFTAEGPIEELTIKVEGEVDTFDTHSILRGASERLPPELFLRETPLTATPAEGRNFAVAATRSHHGDLDKMHALLGAVHGHLAQETADPHLTMGADAAFAAARAVTADFAHVLIALARSLEIPARFIRGYLLAETPAAAATAHAWIEAHIGGLGWVGFDPVAGRCPDENYIRVAAGLDGLGAAPIRGRRSGGGGESMKVEITVGPAWPTMRDNQ
jgi:transglutaminase-like putative cysteine protease